MFLHNICHAYLSHHGLFKGIHFVLSYPTQRWNTHVAGNLSKIKNGTNEACHKNYKTSSIILKRYPKGDVS